MGGVGSMIFGPTPIKRDHGNSCRKVTHNPRARVRAAAISTQHQSMRGGEAERIGLWFRLPLGLLVLFCA
jgi:hypothetical protein